MHTLIKCPPAFFFLAIFCLFLLILFLVGSCSGSEGLDGDGLGLISYYDVTNADLKVAHCSNTNCTAATISTLDSTGNVGWETSITIGADDLGLISYYDDDFNTKDDLKVAHCSNTNCTSATITTLDSTGNVGWDSSITIGADGLGLISYSDSTNQDLKVAHCSNTNCTSATTTTLDSTGNVGMHTSITIGADGLGLISYHDSTNLDLKVAHCENAFCAPYFRRR
jgi:preprotein translocase subunit Sec61beta